MDVFSVVTSADMRKMTPDELSNYLRKGHTWFLGAGACEVLQQVIKQLESIPHPTQEQIESALSQAVLLDGPSTTAKQARAQLAAILKSALEATLPKEIGLAAQTFETLRDAEGALEELDTLDGDAKAEALEGVREKLEALRKDFDALSFPNLTEEEKAALKEKMEAGLAALNDFLEGKEGSLSPEALKEMLTGLKADMDNYWYSLEDYQEDREKPQTDVNMETMRQMNDSELHDFLKTVFGVSLKDSGVQKVHTALEALASVQNPTREQVLAALKNTGLKIADESYDKLAWGILAVLDVPSGQEEE